MSSKELKQIEPEKTAQTESLRSGRKRAMNSTTTTGAKVTDYSTGMSTIRSPSEERESLQGEENASSYEPIQSMPRTSEDDLTDHKTVKEALESLKKQVHWFRNNFKSQQNLSTRFESLFETIETEVNDFIAKLLIVTDRSLFYTTAIKQANKIKADLKKAKIDLQNESARSGIQETQTDSEDQPNKQLESDEQSINQFNLQTET